MTFQFSSPLTDLPARQAELFKLIRGSLIVSAQAPEGHPLRDTQALTRIAAAAAAGGATAIRCGGYGGLADISAIAQAVEVPVFGLTKEGASGVYITPSAQSVAAVARAGATVVCADATGRPRPDGSSTEELVETAHREGALFMADCATPQDAAAAVHAGADLVSTTLAGYTPDREKTPGPDLECLSQARGLIGTEAFLIGEGRYHCPADVARGFELGANAVIVGTAITDVAWVTRSFAAAAQG